MTVIIKQSRFITIQPRQPLPEPLRRLLVCHQFTPNGRDWRRVESRIERVEEGELWGIVEHLGEHRKREEARSHGSG